MVQVNNCLANTFRSNYELNYKKKILSIVGFLLVIDAQQIGFNLLASARITCSRDKFTLRSISQGGR